MIFVRFPEDILLKFDGIVAKASGFELGKKVRHFLDCKRKFQPKYNSLENFLQSGRDRKVMRIRTYFQGSLIPLW